LPRGGAQRGLGLHGGIIAQAAEHDGAHLIAEAGKAAEFVEHALAPQERVGVERQFVAVRAQLELRVRTMIIEIAGDDAVLQHAAERQAVAARRPGHRFADDIIRAEQHDGAEQQRQRRRCESGARHQLGIEPGQQQRRCAEPEQHCKGGAVG
jgi:hypothetical protein